MKTAIILAAGQGRKMWPYGLTKNKAYLPVAAKPLIRIMAGQLAQCGIEEIVVVTGYRAGQLAHAVGDLEGVSFAAQAGQAPGTATALLSGWKATSAADVLVLYGDCLIAKEDITRLVAAYEKGGTGAAMLAAKLPDFERPNDWLCTSIADGRVREVKGHSRGGDHRVGGAFCFGEDFKTYLERNPGVMHRIDVGMMSPTEAQLEESVNLAIEDKREVVAVTAEELCVDLDKPWHILEANRRYLEYAAKRLENDIIPASAQIHDSAEINGRVVLGDNVVIGKNVSIGGMLWVGNNTKITEGAMVGGPTAIGANCTVKRYCQVGGGASLGDECYVGHCAEVDGVMFRKSYAYHYGEYWGVIGQNTDLGAATVCGTLRFDDLDTQQVTAGHKEGFHPGVNASYLGDYCRTGVNVIIMPGVKVGPYCVIGAGTLLTEDVPENTCIYVKQELVKRRWGPERYGW